MFISFLCASSLISADDHSYLLSLNPPARIGNKFVSQVKSSGVLELSYINFQELKF